MYGGINILVMNTDSKSKHKRKLSYHSFNQKMKLIKEINNKSIKNDCIGLNDLKIDYDLPLPSKELAEESFDNGMKDKSLQKNNQMNISKYKNNYRKISKNSCNSVEEINIESGKNLNKIRNHINSRSIHSKAKLTENFILKNNERLEKLKKNDPYYVNYSNFNNFLSTNKEFLDNSMYLNSSHNNEFHLENIDKESSRIYFGNKLLKNANERDISTNEDQFFITNTQNFKNNINISINKINPTFQNSDTSMFPIKENTKKIYTDLSYYLKCPPNIDSTINCSNFNNNLISREDNDKSFLKSLLSPNKIYLNPIKKNESKPEQLVFNSISTNQINESDINILNISSAQNKKASLMSIIKTKNKNDHILFMPKYLKLKKYQNHPFNKYLKINQIPENKNDNILDEIDELQHHRKKVYENDNNNFIEKKSNNSNFNQKREKGINFKRNRLKPITISNENAIKNISNLVYDIMEKNNVVTSINNMYEEDISNVFMKQNDNE